MTGRVFSPLVAVTITAALSMGAAQAQTPTDGGTVIFALGSDPDFINRNISSQPDNGIVACTIYEGLTRVDGQGGIAPLLAKSWEISEDGKTYTFPLQDASFTDGKPLTSQDVKYSLTEVSAKYSAVFAGAAGAIDTIDTPDPKTVVINLKYPYGPFLRALDCLNGGGVLPAHIFQGTDVMTNDANRNPVGSGPFMLEKWDRGSAVHLVKNPDYWQEGKPHLDGLIGQIIPQASARTLALLSGAIDMVPYYYVAVNDWPQLRANPDLRLVPSKVPPALSFLGLNLESPELQDKKVRHALAMATDREFMLQKAFQGAGKVAKMPFPSGIAWAADTSIDFDALYPYDIEAANKLLDEAGKPRGPDGTRFTLRLVYRSTDTDSPLVATALQQMWAQIGVKLDLRGTEAAAASDAIYAKKDFDVAVLSYASFGDPALGLARIYVTSSIGKTNGNASSYSNPEVDDLFAKAEQAVGEEARGAIYRQVQQIVADELPVIDLREVDFNDAMNKKVMGVDDEYFFFSWRDGYLAE